MPIIFILKLPVLLDFFWGFLGVKFSLDLGTFTILSLTQFQALPWWLDLLMLWSNRREVRGQIFFTGVYVSSLTVVTSWLWALLWTAWWFPQKYLPLLPLPYFRVFFCPWGLLSSLFTSQVLLAMDDFTQSLLVHTVLGCCFELFCATDNLLMEFEIN